MLAVALLFGVIFLSGYLTRLPRESRFSLPKAFVLVLSECLLGILFFALIWMTFILTGGLALLLSSVNSLFLLILTVAVLDGIILYWVQVALFPKLTCINSQVLTLAEYIIQWALIYMTVYQVIFDGLFAKANLEALNQLNVSHPTDLMVLILPSLISVWIAVILYKVRQQQL